MNQRDFMMAPVQGSIIVQRKLEEHSWCKSSQSVVAKKGIKQNIGWVKDGLKPASERGVGHLKNWICCFWFLLSIWRDFSTWVKLNISQQFVLNVKLWIQFKALPCVFCTKCKFMHPTGASWSYRENNTAFLPPHPSLLLYLIQALQCKRCFLWCVLTLCLLTLTVPEDRKVSCMDGNISFLFVYLSSLSHCNISHKTLKTTLCSLDHLLPTH